MNDVWKWGKSAMVAIDEKGNLRISKCGCRNNWDSFSFFFLQLGVRIIRIARLGYTLKPL